MRSETNIFHKKAGVLFFLLLSVSLISSGANAGNNCFSVSGRFESQNVPPPECTSPVSFCTSGSLTGALWGDYELVVDKFISPEEPSVPAVSFYTGFSSVSTRRGELFLTDAGALDGQTGNVSALLKATGGTGYYENATGYLYVYGAADLSAGKASGRYEGEICIEN
jgi:hypothetical protein